MSPLEGRQFFPSICRLGHLSLPKGVVHWTPANLVWFESSEALRQFAVMNKSGISDKLTLDHFKDCHFILHIGRSSQSHLEITQDRWTVLCDQIYTTAQTMIMLNHEFRLTRRHNWPVYSKAGIIVGKVHEDSNSEFTWGWYSVTRRHQSDQITGLRLSWCCNHVVAWKRTTDSQRNLM